MPNPEGYNQYKKKSGWIRAAGKAGLIAGGALVGGVLGARTLPRLIGKGRVLQAGESLAGKILYHHEGLTTPAQVVVLPATKKVRELTGQRFVSLEQILRRASKDKGIKGKVARAMRKADEFLGVPQRHYAVGLGGGRVADITRGEGQRIIPVEKLGKNIRVHGEGRLVPKGTTLADEAKAIDKKEVKAFEERYTSMKDWKKGDLCTIGDKNCEAYARGIGEGRKISTQIRALKAGAIGGAAVGAAPGVAMSIPRKEKQVNNVRAILNKWSDKAREASLAARRAKKKGAWAQSDLAHKVGARARTAIDHFGAAELHKQAAASHLGTKGKFGKEVVAHHKSLAAKHEKAAKSQGKSTLKGLIAGAASGAVAGGALGKTAGGAGLLSGAALGALGGMAAGSSAGQVLVRPKVDQEGAYKTSKVGDATRVAASVLGGVALTGAALATGRSMGLKFIRSPERAPEILKMVARRLRPGPETEARLAAMEKPGGGQATREQLGRILDRVKSVFKKDTWSKAANKVRKAAGRPIKGEVLPKQLMIGNSLQEMLQVINGGPGSGFHGHKGIPGHRGGSLAEGASVPAPRTSSAALSRILGPQLSETPQARARRQKNAVTRASKLADVLSSHADSLERKRKKKLLPLNASELRNLYETHQAAAENFKESALQATLLKVMTPEEQRARLEKAEYHQALADKYANRLGHKGSVKRTAGTVGKAFLYGALGGTPEQLAERIGQRLGQTSADIVATTARAGATQLRRELGKTVTETRDMSMPLSELEAAEALIRRTGKGPLTERQRTEYTKPNIQTTTRKRTYSEIAQAVGDKMKNVSAARATQLAQEAISEPRIRQRQDLEAALRIAAAMRQRAEQENKLRRALSVTTRKSGSRSRRNTREPAQSSAESQRTLSAVEKLLRAQAEEAARVYDKEGPPTHNCEFPTANFTGQIRRETLHGRDYVVAPLTMIVPGVLAGSKGPLLYPEDEVGKNPNAWNGMPIVVNHPTKDGSPVEARSPGILEKYQIGTVFNAKYDGRLVAEGWFDVDRTKNVNSSILAQIMASKPIELSTGLYTDNEPFEGTWNGRAYKFVARNYRPDHLAILVGSRGACSIKDGCGVLVNTWSDAARAASLAVRRHLGKSLAVGGTSAAGGVVGGLYGWLGGNIAASPLSKKVFESMSKGPQVDSKAYLKKLGESKVKVISSPADITSEIDPKNRLQLIVLAKLAEQGKFAGAARSKNGDEYMIVPAKTSAEVIDHELGHFRDQRKTKSIKGWELGPIGAFTGHQLKREQAAWREGGSKNDSEMKKAALKSYGRVATGTRIGAGAGVLGGALYALKVLKAK